MASTAVSSSTVPIRFEWMGSTTFDESDVCYRGIVTVHLTFGDANEGIGVVLPKDANPDQPLSLRFTYVKRLNGTDGELEETTPDVLSETLDRIRNLKVMVRVFSYAKKDQIIAREPIAGCYKTVEVQIPQDLVIGKLYKLMVSHNNFVLSARVVEQTNPSSESKE